MSGLVLDEADEMLQMGFAEDVEWVLQRMPQERQIALFSRPRFPNRSVEFGAHLRKPAEITIEAEIRHARDAQALRDVATHPDQKREVLARILEAEPIDGVLVFVNTKGTSRTARPVPRALGALNRRTKR